MLTQNSIKIILNLVIVRALHRNKLDAMGRDRLP